MVLAYANAHGHVGSFTEHASEARTMDAGIARKIDDLGRVVIPAETRRLFNIREGDQLLISVEGPHIVMRKLTSTCTFCGAEDHVTDFRGKGVCTSCRNQLLL